MGRATIVADAASGFCVGAVTSVVLFATHLTPLGSALVNAVDLGRPRIILALVTTATFAIGSALSGFVIRSAENR